MDAQTFSRGEMFIETAANRDRKLRQERHLVAPISLQLTTDHEQLTTEYADLRSRNFLR
jgi:hypothetical protein